MTVRYPLFADLAGRRCLVVGGGAVATRKAGGLLPTGAQLLVVAPRLSPQLRQWHDERRLLAECRPFRGDDVAGMALVFVATDDARVNAEAARAAREAGAWVNVADDPDASDFFVPAVWRDHDVAVAVSTQGGVPALAAWLRDRAGGAMPGEIGLLARLLAEVRAQSSTPLAKESWQNLFESGILDDLAREGLVGVKAGIDRVFGPGAYERARASMKEKP